MPHPVVTVAATPSHVAGKIKSSSAPPTSAKVRVVGKPHEDVANGTGCLVCGNHDNEEKILLCEQCDGEYHTFCVQLDDIPEGEWYCGKCDGNCVESRWWRSWILVLLCAEYL